MKRTNYRLMLTLISCLGMAGLVNAQFDDIYFNPSDADEIYAQVDLEKYSSESYESKSVKPDNYDYYYASRMRRFDNPYYGFDFYSPVYVDPAYYNRNYANFYRPGTSIYWGGPTPASTYAYGYRSYASWGYAGTSISTGYGGFNNRYGGFGSAGSYNGFGGASFGGASFGGASFGGSAGGGYNPYCPPSVYGIYSNPSTGIFRPGAGSSIATNPNPRAGTTTAGSPAYGPRGTSGVATSSARKNARLRGNGTAPDRPLVSNPGAGSTQTGRKTYSGSRTASRTAYNGARSDRPVYSAPSSSAGNYSRATNTTKSRFSSTRPSRPSTSGYSPSSRSYPSSSSATKSAFSRQSSSSGVRSSSSRSFSSPRSSGASSSRTSSGASRSGSSRRN